jgi:predicted amidohydrolase
VTPSAGCCAVCVSGDGILGHHRKVHLPSGERTTFGVPRGLIAAAWHGVRPRRLLGARAERRRPV